MNKNKLITWALGAVIALSATVTNAAVRQGMWETSFSGSYSHLKVEDESVDLWLLDVKAGYFVLEPLEISVAANYLKAEVDTFDLRGIMLGAGVDYHFMTQTQLVPYVGGALHWVDVKVGGLGSEDDWAFDVHAGLKQFVSQNVAIKYEVSYLKFDEMDLDGINVSVGLSFFF